jgi:hypothetical protein
MSTVSGRIDSLVFISGTEVDNVIEAHPKKFANYPVECAVCQDGNGTQAWQAVAFITNDGRLLVNRNRVTLTINEMEAILKVMQKGGGF